MAGTNPPPAISDANVTMTFGPNHTYYGYCAIADVKFELTNVGNMPKAADDSVVAQEITYAAIDLQSMLDRYYEMPYLGSNFNILSTLREMNAKLAAAKLMDRYMASVDHAGTVAANYTAHVIGMIHDIGRGITRWDDPFGDAVPRAMLPVYNSADEVSQAPDPVQGEQFAPIFTIAERTRFRRGDSF